MQKRMKWLVGLPMLLCGVVVLAAPPLSKPADVRDLMSVTEFDQAGLNKLSPDEIKSLNAWLNKYLATQHPTAAPASAAHAATALPPVSQAAAVATFGAETLPQTATHEPKRIESRIVGLFSGWTGDTVFTLDNRQVWKQASSGYFTDVKLEHPAVVIKKLAFGYLLTIPGQSETVFVRRIK